MSGAVVSDLLPGLFGKMPAHGDFVRRGWPDEVIDPLDVWLSAGVAETRADRDDEDFSAVMRAGPMWQGYVPPGLLGPLALHLVLAPSVDKVGRLFFLVGGMAGPADAVWAQLVAAPAFAATLDAAMYDALATKLDADSLYAMIASALVAPADRTKRLAGISPPETTAWWIDGSEDALPVILQRATPDVALIGALLTGGDA